MNNVRFFSTLSAPFLIYIPGTSNKNFKFNQDFSSCKSNFYDWIVFYEVDGNIWKFLKRLIWLLEIV
jgi:hypothetical protein